VKPQFDSLSRQVIIALRASSQPFDSIRTGAAALATRASALIRAGESIQNDPDDESATAQFVEISEQLPPQFAAHLGAVERDIDNVKPPQSATPAAPVPVAAPTPAAAPAVTTDDETKARNQKLLEERAAAASASAAGSAVSVAELKSAGLSSAEKAEEERLLRSMQRRGPTTPVSRATPAVAATPSPVASPAAATPAKPASSEVPAWKKQQEAERAQAEQQLKKQEEEARARAARAKQPESPAVASPAPATLSVGAAKAEEERLERVMNRRSGHTAVTPTASPAKPAAAPAAAAAASPATPTTSSAGGGVPEWKRRQQERERELAEKAKQDEEAKAKAADSVLAAAEAAQREREAARTAAVAAAPSTPTQTWEPKPRKQTLEQVATELGATEALKLGSPVAAASSPASASSSRFDDVRCAGCNVMVVGGYKNALGKCWHKECWKCSQCSKPLETKFANVGGKPMCVPCATERAKKAKAAAQQ
jgi:hypothetical protein